MQLLHPWMLFGLLLVPAAVLLHVFRTPGRKQEVSFIGLWERVMERVRVDAAESRRRFDWILLLEILVVILLVLAAAHPVVWQQRPRRHVAFIIDTSASMNTIAPDGRSRWQMARDQMKSIVADLEETDLVSYFCAPAPRQAGEGLEPAVFMAELDSISPRFAPIKPRQLLEDGLLALGESAGAVFLITDNPPPKAAGDFGARLRTVVVGEAGANVGIVALSGTSNGKGGQEVFVRVKNYSDRTFWRRIAVMRGGAGLFQSAHLDEVAIKAGETFEKVYDVAVSRARPIVNVSLRMLTGTPLGADANPLDWDGLKVDDSASLVLRRLRVVAVGEEINPAYVRLFGGTVFEGTEYLEADDIRPGGPSEFLLIADGMIPSAFGRSTVIVNPPEGEAAGIIIGKLRQLEAPASPIVTRQNPLSTSVDFREVTLKSYRPLILPDGAEALLHVGSDIVAASLEHTAGRIVVLGFDPSSSRWQLRPGFVAFWANVFEDAKTRCNAGGLVGYHTGDIARIPIGGKPAMFRRMGGPGMMLSPGKDGWATVSLDDPGVFTIVAEGKTRYLAVSLLSETESDNRRRSVESDNLDLPIPVSSGRNTPLAPWICALAGMIAIAWWFLRQ